MDKQWIVQLYDGEMKPREINPDGIPDDQWWDIEALKLAVVAPGIFADYARDWRGWADGSRGLAFLDFLDRSNGPPDGPFNADQPFNQARIANFGMLLVAACKRVSK
jgi:hypothetical protein